MVRLPSRKEGERIGRLMLATRFAGVLAVGYEKYGSEEALEADAITHLYDVYVKINADGTKVDAEGKPDAENGVAPDPTVHDRAREFFVRMEAGAPFFDH